MKHIRLLEDITKNSSEEIILEISAKSDLDQYHTL